jgi:hypothetical protein
VEFQRSNKTELTKKLYPICSASQLTVISEQVVQRNIQDTGSETGCPTLVAALSRLWRKSKPIICSYSLSLNSNSESRVTSALVYASVCRGFSARIYPRADRVSLFKTSERPVKKIRTEMTDNFRQTVAAGYKGQGMPLRHFSAHHPNISIRFNQVFYYCISHRYLV